MGPQTGVPLLSEPIAALGIETEAGHGGFMQLVCSQAVSAMPPAVLPEIYIGSSQVYKCP